MCGLLGIDVGNGIDPAKILLELGLGSGVKAQVLLWRQFQQGFEFLMHGRHVFFLQDNQVLPAILVAAGEGRAARKEPIQHQANR